MQTVKFELTGATPLLMHMDDVEQADELTEWRKAPANRDVSKPGDDRSPAWTWQTYTYHDGANVALPAENLMVALRQAGAQKIMKRQKTFKEITQSGLCVTTEYLDFFVGGGKPIPISVLAEMRDDDFKAQANAARENGFRLFVKRARVGQSKHIRVRPRFDVWSARGRMDILNPTITVDILRELFELAGPIGLCDWRPGCRTPGMFGRFTAKITT